MPQPLINRNQVESLSETYTASATPPLNPSLGDRWLHTESGVLFTYVADGDSFQWAEFGGSGGGDTGTGGGSSSSGTTTLSNPNLTITDQISHDITTALTVSAFSVPANKRAIVHSILVTNLTSNPEPLFAEISYNGAQISLANNMIIPANSSVELLYRFKVLTQTDTINFQANTNNALQAIIAWGEVDDLTYFGGGVDLVTTDTTTLYTSTNEPSEIHSILVTNDSPTDGNITVTWTDVFNNTLGYFSFEMLIPSNASIELLENPKRLEIGQKVRVASTDPNELEVHIAGRILPVSLLPAPPVLGNPDLTLNKQIGTAISTTLSDSGVVIPPNTRGFIRSLHVTNIGGVQCDLSAEINYGGTNPISLIDTAPVAANSSVELLFRPKVMQPGDTINLQASSPNCLHATIAWGELTDLTYFGSGVDLTTNLLTTMMVTPEDTIIESILVVNDSPTDIAKVKIVWTDDLDTIIGYFAFDMEIPAHSSMEILQNKKFLPNGHKIKISALNSNRVEAHISGRLQDPALISPPAPPIPGSPVVIFHKQVAHDITTSLTNPSIPIGTGFIGIIESIMVTNISNTPANLTGEISYGGTNPISFADEITIPVGSTVEFIKKPKVMIPGDIMNFKANLPNNLQAIITWKEVNDDTYFGTGVDLTTTVPTNVYTAATNTAVINSILVSNDSVTNDALIDILWTNSTEVVQGVLVNDLVVPKQSSIEIAQNPKWLPLGHKIMAQTDTPNYVEVMIAGKRQITGIPPIPTIDVSATDLTVNNQLKYTPTTSLASSGVVIPAGFVGILRSIQVTNLTSSTQELTSELNYSGSNPISLGENIPIAGGSTIELLLRHKTISDTDSLNFKATANNAFDIVITWELTSDITYFGDGVDLINTNENTIFTSTGATGLLNSILMVNDSASDSPLINVLWTNAFDVPQAYLLKDTLIAPKSTIEVLDNIKHIPIGHKIKVSSSIANTVEAHVAGKILIGPIDGVDPILRINKQLSFDIPTTLSNSGVVIPSGSKGIIRSVHIANVTNTSVDVTAEINYGGTNPVSLADAIPVEPNSSIELALKTKVMSPGDVLNLQASLINGLEAIITWEETTDLSYFGSGVDLIDANETDLFTATTGNAVITSITVVNDSPTNNNNISVLWTDGSNNPMGYLAKNLAIPLHSSMEVILNSKWIPVGHKIRVQASSGNDLEVHISGLM